MGSMRDEAELPRSDNDNGLVEGLDPREYPYLAKLLDGPAAPAIAAELGNLLRRQPRAARRAVELLGRLEGAGFRETVRIRDLSATGTRLRLARRGCLDLMNADLMRLRCRVASDDLSDGADLDVWVSLVRVVAMDEDQLELGFRFVNLNSEQMRILASMERLYFFQ